MSTCNFNKLCRAVVMACSALVTGALAPPAFAASVLEQSVFELGPGANCDEGGLTNILDDGNCGGTTGPDWSVMFQQQPNGSVTTVNNFGGTAVFLKDGASGGVFPDETTFTSQGGDTNNELVTQWTWSSTSVPSKDDVSNAYAYIVTPTTGPLAGHTLLYVGGERETPNGDSHIDFEFFQDSVQLNPNVSPKSFSGVNIIPGAVFNGQTFAHGDLLVSMDFTKGGDLAGLEVRERTGNSLKGNVDNYTLRANLPGQGCIKADGTTTTGTDAVVCAFSNGDTIGTIPGRPATWPWDSFDNNGNVVHALAKNAFTEWGIDLTALGLGHPCFPSVMVKTRSSQSFTAQLKDFAIRGFETCTTTISTKIIRNSDGQDITNGTVVAGTVFHDTATLDFSGSSQIPTGTVTYNFFNNLTCSGTPASTEPVTVTAAGLVPNASDVTAQPGTTISFNALYGGDSNFAAATSACEPLTVLEIQSHVTTDIRKDTPSGDSLLNTAVDTSGGTVNAVDVATVTATVPTGVTSPLGDAACPAGTHPASGIDGSVTFTRYTTADCTGTAVTEHTCVGTTTFSGATASATASSSVDPLSGSTFLCFKATYNGNAAYNPSPVSTIEPLCAFPFVTQQ